MKKTLIGLLAGGLTALLSSTPAACSMPLAERSVRLRRMHPVTESRCRPKVLARVFRNREIGMKLFFISVFACAAVLLAGCGGLRKSEERITREILNQVPLNSDISKVLAFLKSENYEITVDRKGGFYDQRVRPATETGKMSIRANFGDYRGFIFRVNVTVYFAFDKDGKLIDIWVWKTTDAP